MQSTNTKILIGTTKGAFLLHGENDRTAWQMTGPYCDGWCINHVIGDPASGTIWAGGGNEFHGAGIWHSEDGGETWHLTRLSRGMLDEWAEQDPDFAAMVSWSKDPRPLFRNQLRINFRQP